MFLLWTDLQNHQYSITPSHIFRKLHNDVKLFMILLNFDEIMKFFKFLEKITNGIMKSTISRELHLVSKENLCFGM